MRDFCEKERLRDGKYLGTRERETEERAMMRENFLGDVPR
jgi:hypothetical protein